MLLNELGHQTELPTKQRALRARFDAHLIKPIDFRELQRLLSALAG